MRTLREKNVHSVPVPSTQGIKYAGSKKKILPYLLSIIQQLPDIKSVLDGFSGTTRVSQALAKCNYHLTCNDISEWSYVFGKCYLCSVKDTSYYVNLICHLNQVSPTHGWFSEHYGGEGRTSVQSDGKKRPWQLKNTRKLDGIRQEIDRLCLDEQDRCVALTALILALDRVDNTLGHYCSYLKGWSARSYEDLKLELPAILPAKQHQVYKRDIFALLDQQQVDLAYFDPPYGSNNEKMPPSRVRYAAYYHIWTTIIKNDNPGVFGAARRRQDSSDLVASSVFEEYRMDESRQFLAVNAIERLVANAQARYVILSYSSGGRATEQALHKVLRRHGKLLDVVQINHRKHVMATMSWTGQWQADTQSTNYEYLFILQK